MLRAFLWGVALWISIAPRVLAQSAPASGGTLSEAEYLQKAPQASIFIYEATTKPCEPPRPNTVLAPIGSGFVVGLSKKGSTPANWVGWKFLITAKHVIGSRTQVILRLNLSKGSGFTCFPLDLVMDGDHQNVFPASTGIDIDAVNIPNIPGTDPVVFAYSMILDDSGISSHQIGVGTGIFTVGYLFGYSGEHQNFPVTKFGEISILTREKWYLNPDSHSYEQAYLVQLPNAPGLSGAPALTHGYEFRDNPFQYRHLPPLILGVVKGLLLAPVGNNKISQDLAAVEPGANLKDLLGQIAERFRTSGAEIELQ